MVAILPAAFFIEVDRLNMSIGFGTDPHGAPPSRNDQTANAPERLGVGDPMTRRVAVRKAPARAAPRDPRRIRADVRQTGGHRGVGVKVVTVDRVSTSSDVMNVSKKVSEAAFYSHGLLVFDRVVNGLERIISLSR